MGIAADGGNHHLEPSGSATWEPAFMLELPMAMVFWMTRSSLSAAALEHGQRGSSLSPIKRQSVEDSI
jgi:hypothetical protein